jgi:hypothetical protein
VYNKITSARLTTMAAGTNLDLKLKRLQIGIENDRFKTEA